MKHLIAATALALVTATGAFAEGVTHYLAIHVDENDPAVMNMALNNAQNVVNHYAAQGDSVVVELVAYGPGLHMFRADTSPVADRIAAMGLEVENLSFSACGNTLAGMTRQAGAEVALLDGVEVTPSGVVRLMELQQQGYAYIRP
jgi:intracellular sulfur oxidation DsrE/DsrF family protein